MHSLCLRDRERMETRSLLSFVGFNMIFLPNILKISYLKIRKHDENRKSSFTEFYNVGRILWLGPHLTDEKLNIASVV